MATPGVAFKVFGILNLTPDSFSDGGLYLDPGSAFARFQELLDEGADFVDVGAESTRPGAKPLDESEEWGRIEPFLTLLGKRGLLSKVSIDTRKWTIMRQVAEMNVSFINNVGSLPDAPQLSRIFAAHPGLSYIACHMHGTPDVMQLNPLGPKAATKRVQAFFEESTSELRDAGCAADKIYMDPGIGFGKTDAANWALLMNTGLYSAKYKTAIGVSRKGFIGRSLGGETPSSRDPASKLVEIEAAYSGASIIRTHDVKGLLKLAKIFAEAKS